MSGVELGVTELGEMFVRLTGRVDRVEAEGLRQSQALADCVVRLGKALAALQDQVTMIREAAGLMDDRRAS